MRNLLKQQRLSSKLHHELGAVILSYLSDPQIIEIMLNPDGQIWVEHIKEGFKPTGETLESSTALQLMGSIAEQAGMIVNREHPILETQLPTLNYRFTGVIPPVVTAPCFAIRKASPRLFTLDDYVAREVLTRSQWEVIHSAILTRETILIAGGPGTGKTTFANALLHDMVKLGDPHQRIVIIEDTPELRCEAANTLFLKTSDTVDYDQLLRTALRQRADKICVGECRGKEMLTLLNAWNTGTRGGLTTIHANCAHSALLRVSDLAQQAGQAVSPSLICESIHLIIALGFDECKGRSIQSMGHVMGYQGGHYVFNTIRTTTPRSANESVLGPLVCAT